MPVSPITGVKRLSHRNCTFCYEKAEHAKRLYSLDHATKQSRYARLNEAFGLLLSGGEGALALLDGEASAFDESDPADALPCGVARRLRGVTLSANVEAYCNPMPNFYAMLIGAEEEEPGAPMFSVETDVVQPFVVATAN